MHELLLTDVNIHNYYEGLGTAKTVALLNAFNELVIKEGSVKPKDIIDTFAKYGIKEEVYDRFYLHNENFDIDLQKFNDRKDELKVLGLEGFMEKYENDYKALYDRFYTTFKRDNNRHIMLFVTSSVKELIEGKFVETARNYSDWIATDYYFSKNPDLMDYFTYHPQIFKYWFGV